MTQQVEETLGVDYDPIVDEYAEKYFQELDHKPIDRKLLDRLGTLVSGLGPVCDLGCGPGQIARYLHERGVEAFGLDLSDEMVKLARRLSPNIEFKQGDMMALDIEKNTLGGIAAFYSILHVARSQVVEVLREFSRVLVPGGWLLLAFHIGDEMLHVDELWGRSVSLDFVLFESEEMEAYLNEAGYANVEIIEREPYMGVEYESRRAYIFARKPREE